MGACSHSTVEIRCLDSCIASIVARQSYEFVSPALAAGGKVAATVKTQPLEAVNAVLDRMRAGTIDGRVVLEL